MIKSLSIIFPIYNEELRLKSSFNHIQTFLKKKKSFNIEIIFVDDGSFDNSYTLIDQFAKSFKNLKKNNKFKIKVIKSKKNLGKGSALRLGAKKAIYNWILTTDIDMSVSLFQICDWIKKKFINKKYFVYFGSRTHKKSIVKQELYRKILGNIMKSVIFPRTYKFLSYEELENNLNVMDYQHEGYMLYSKDKKDRTKVKGIQYIMAKEVKGNNNNVRFIALEK